MIYGIERSTDKRYPGTKIVTLKSEAAAAKWLAKPCVFSFPGAADESLPPSQSNFHRQIRFAYVMPAGWRKAGADVKRRVNKTVQHWRGSICAKSESDALADIIAEDGTELK